MSRMSKLALVTVAAMGLGLSAAASAHDRGHGHGHGHKHRHWQGHYAGHYYHPGPGYVVRERVVVHRPVYVAPPAYYYAPPPRYPGVVVSVDIPPIVFPIR